MSFKINQAALGTLKKVKKDAVRKRVIAGCGLFIFASMAFLSRTSGRDTSSLAFSVFILLLLTAIYFMFIRSYKKQKFLLKHIIEAVNVADGKGVFSFAEDLDYEVVEMPFVIGQLSMVSPSKEEIANFKGKYFTVFQFPIGRAYLVKEYWDDFSAVLVSLELSKEELVVVEPEPFLSRMHKRGLDLKTQCYGQCLTASAFGILVAFGGIKNQISLVASIIGGIACVVFLFFMTAFPTLNKIKLISRLVHKMEIKNNICYFYCSTVFNDILKCHEYNLGAISAAEWEVYQEVFFKNEAFLVLNAKNEKFYLVGDVLAQYGKMFGHAHVAI